MWFLCVQVGGGAGQVPDKSQEQAPWSRDEGWFGDLPLTT